MSDKRGHRHHRWGEGPITLDFLKTSDATVARLYRVLSKNARQTRHEIEQSYAVEYQPPISSGNAVQIFRKKLVREGWVTVEVEKARVLGGYIFRYTAVTPTIEGLATRGYNRRQIAKILSLHPGTVGKYAVDHGITLPPDRTVQPEKLFGRFIDGLEGLEPTLALIRSLDLEDVSDIAKKDLRRACMKAARALIALSHAVARSDRHRG